MEEDLSVRRACHARKDGLPNRACTDRSGGMSTSQVSICRNEPCKDAMAGLIPTKGSSGLYSRSDLAQLLPMAPTKRKSSFLAVDSLK